MTLHERNAPHTLMASKASACLVVLLLGPAQNPTAEPVADAKPPARLSQVEKGEGIVSPAPTVPPQSSDNPVRGRIAYSLNERTVTLRWAWTSNGPRPDQHSDQTESVAYWPTEAVGAGPGRAVVAGRRPNGNTVIELWTLGNAPVLAGHEDPPGTWIYPELVIPVASRVALFDESTLGRKMTGTIFWNPVPPSGCAISLYVLFDDSRDLCRLDRTDAGVTKIQRLFSMSSGSGVPQVRALECQQKARWSGDHTQLGFVYVLTNSMHFDPTCQTVVFVDRDRDGRIDADGALTPSDAECEELGLGRADLFTAFY